MELYSIGRARPDVARIILHATLSYITDPIPRAISDIKPTEILEPLG